MNYWIDKSLNSNFVAIWGQLHNELVYLRENDLFNSDIGKRTYIKSFITLIEGMAYALRQHMIVDINITLSPEELLVLKEQKIEIEDNGAIKVIDKQYRSLNLFKFTFKTFGKHYNKMEIIVSEFERDGFSKLKETYKKRNRLTHPKSAEELHITKDDMQYAAKAHEWFHEFIKQAFEGVLITKRQ